VRQVGQALSTAVGDVGRGVASRQAALAAVREARRVMGGAPMPPLTSTPVAFATDAGAGSGEGEGGHHPPASYSLLPPSHPLRDAPASPYLLGGIYVGRMHASDGRMPAFAAPSSSSASAAVASSPTSPGFDPRSLDPNDWSYDGGAE